MSKKKQTDDQPQARQTDAKSSADVDEVIDGVRIRVFATDGGYEAIAGDEDYVGEGQHNVQCYTDTWPLDAVKVMARAHLGANMAPVATTEE
jgi:hypothetical protein